MTDAPQLFTAALLASALDKAPRSIRRALEGVPHSSVDFISGQETKVWTLASLEKVFAVEFAERRRDIGCRDNLELFAPDVRPPWSPRIPLNEVDDEHRAKAVKLQRALLPALEAYHAGELAGADLEARGLADYQSHFGHPIALRTWRYLFQRARERARNASDYARVDLFLDDNCARKRELPAALNVDEEFAPLHQFIALFQDPLNPTPKEREALWYQSCKLFHPRATDKAFKRALLDFLWNCGARPATTREGLRINFGRKYEKWVETWGKPSALRDGRNERLGIQIAAQFLPADLTAIIGYALFNCGARLPQAIRELNEMGAGSELSREMRDYIAGFLSHDTNKSYVPERLREAVRYDLELLPVHHLGPRAADGASAWVKRGWSKVSSMYALTMDDVTLPIYMWVRDKSGKVILTRGQCIITVDCRSRCILGLSLQPDRNYNSLVIRTLITKVCSEHGLPRIFQFERGIWKTSKLLKGNALGLEMREAGEPFSWPECEHGLSEFGVKFIHCIRPRSKIVERVIGLLQDLMEGEPGYCGREERKDRPEDLSKKMYAVEHGEDPSQWFYSFAQWEERLDALCKKYNAARHGKGTALDGMSPDQAFEACKATDPDNLPVKFGPDCRYLLAREKVSKVVGTNGVTLRYGKEAFVYRDAQTGPLRARTVLCWFDPEAPEYLVITDMNRKNAITVEREHRDGVHPFDTESPRYHHETAKAKAHSAHGRARYRVVKAAAGKFRHVVADRAAAELGQQIKEQRAELKAAHRQQESLHRKATRLHEALGMPTALVPDDVTAEYVQGLEDMRAASRVEIGEET